MGKKKKKGFDVDFKIDGGFKKFYIFLYAKKKYSKHYEPVGYITFQQELGSNEIPYGANINLSYGEAFELDMLNKIVKDIKNKVSDWKRDFYKVLNYLKKNYYRVAYDERLKDFIRVVDRPKVRIKRYRLRLNGQVVYTVLASNLNKAKEEMAKKIKNKINNDNVYREKLIPQLKKWLNEPFLELDQSTIEEENRIEEIKDLEFIEESYLEGFLAVS